RSDSAEPIPKHATKPVGGTYAAVGGENGFCGDGLGCGGDAAGGCARGVPAVVHVSPGQVQRLGQPPHYAAVSAIFSSATDGETKGTEGGVSVGFAAGRGL